MATTRCLSRATLPESDQVVKLNPIEAVRSTVAATSSVVGR